MYASFYFLQWNKKIEHDCEHCWCHQYDAKLILENIFFSGFLSVNG